MIFGSLSENLLLTILQRLQELYSEITAGRADSNLATRYVGICLVPRLSLGLEMRLEFYTLCS